MNLYKYRPLNDWTIKGLKEKTIHFTCPADYNDPFDCRINFFVDGPDEDWENYRQRLGWSTEQLNTYRSISTIKKEHAGVYNRDLRKHALLYQRISCFSERFDNILMWSHYADCHRGICLVFEATDHPELPYLTFDNNDFNYPNQMLLSNQAAFIRVRYDDEMPPPYNHLKYDRMEIAPFLIIKSPEWSYEREWRLVSSRDQLKTDDPRYHDNQLKGVIFGLHCSLENIKIVRDTLSDQNIQFYLAVALSDQYKLGVIKIK